MSIAICIGFCPIIFFSFGNYNRIHDPDGPQAAHWADNVKKQNDPVLLYKRSLVYTEKNGRAASWTGGGVENKFSHADLCLRVAGHKVCYAQKAAQKWG